MRAADGKGGNWTKRVAIADDHEEADGENVLTWWQAQDKARKLARGNNADATRPATVKDAVDAYEKDLIARPRGRVSPRLGDHAACALANLALRGNSERRATRRRTAVNVVLGDVIASIASGPRRTSASQVLGEHIQRYIHIYAYETYNIPY
jgi:hypothetical protein